MLKVIIGLIVPFIAMVVLLPCINHLQWAPLAIPMLYWWLIMCCLLATACLMICWFCFDRNNDDTDEEDK
ncbi:hypothetical protein LMG33818_001480 [Halomonadaceae bacterium LMG 33818]|uniref:DUF3311 domain-containing protein n=1 Tax=Cernens ardua TaxID=3402176 RepID=UPI003EDC4D74